MTIVLADTSTLPGLAKLIERLEAWADDYEQLVQDVFGGGLYRAPSRLRTWGASTSSGSSSSRNPAGTS